MVYNIPNFALIKLYNYYYVVESCSLSTENALIWITTFNTILLLHLYATINNIELPIQDNTEDKTVVVNLEIQPDTIDIPGLLIGLGIVF